MVIARGFLAGLLALWAQGASAALIAEFYPIEHRNTPITRVSGLSADGTTVVGSVWPLPGLQSSLPFYWTRDEGVQTLANGFWPPPPIYRPGGYATAVSADGRVVVGGGFVPNLAFRWTPETGAQRLKGDLESKIGTSAAYGVSADGATVVGSASFDGFARNGAFRWTQESGYQDLGFAGTAYGISADARTIVGATRDGQTFRWTEAEGRQDLGSGAAYAISADGTTIVGARNTPSGTEAFRWTAEEGIQGLGDLPGGAFGSTAYAVSADGRVIVGASSGLGLANGAFIWDAEHGMRGLQQLLIEDYGLGERLRDWQLTSATGVSADGLVIAGIARVLGDLYPLDGRGWLVRFVPSDVPEPASLALLGPPLALGWLWSRRRQPSPGFANASRKRQ